MKKVLSVLTTILIFCAVNSSVSAASSDIVVFEDENVKLAVNTYLYVEDKHADVTEAQIEQLGYLSLSAGVTSLVGLEKATNLSMIDLNKSDAPQESALNFDPLVGLQKLKGMGVYGNGDLKQLKKLNNLTDLRVYVDKEADLSELIMMQTIESLGIYGMYMDNNVNFDFNETVANLSNLKKLSIRQLDFLSNPNMSKLGLLESISLFDTNIEDVSTISKVAPLKKISLADNNKITNLSYLSDFRGVENLYVSNSPLESIEFLKEMDLEKMELLTLDQLNLNNISIFSELNMPALTTLALSGNAILDFTPLAKYEGTSIDINATGQKIVMDPINLGDVTMINLVDHLGNKLMLKQGLDYRNTGEIYGTFIQVSDGILWNEITPKDNILFNTLSALNYDYDSNIAPNICIEIIVIQEVKEKKNESKKVNGPDTGDDTNVNKFIILGCFAIATVYVVKKQWKTNR